jgi:isopenicillin N synthase-like dioxygenase
MNSELMMSTFKTKYPFLSLFIAIFLGSSISVYAMDSVKEISHISRPLPQIDLDAFDPAIMEHILLNYGTFELVGPSVDELIPNAVKALEQCREILALPLETLERAYHKANFHGFQNVHKESMELAAQGKGPVRNQIAFHYKPYLEPNFPEGVENREAYATYYGKAKTLVRKLYDAICTSLVTPEMKTVFREDQQTSAMSTRKYFPGSTGETGIPPHSDYGLLTLVISDQQGLEVLEGQNTETGKWISAPFGTIEKPRFYINVGDWMLFQTGRKDFVAGVHRVPSVQELRHSIAFFLNPSPSEELETPSGKTVSFQQFLKSTKKEFHTNPRLL